MARQSTVSVKTGSAASGAAGVTKAPAKKSTPRKAAKKAPIKTADSSAVAATKPATKKPGPKKAAAKSTTPKMSATNASATASTSVDPENSTAGQSEAPQSPREARRLQRIEMSREQILDTAEELFAENGYYETGLKDVAARCEFSVGSIYTFFENKDSLYEQVLMRRSIGLEAIHKLVPDSVPADERLVTLADIQIRHAQEHPAWGALTAELSRIARSRGSVVPEPWHHYGERVFGFLVGVFEKGHEEGTLRPGSPHALASLYHAVVSSFILVSSLSPKSAEEDWPADTEEFLNFVRDTFSSRTPDYLEESAARRQQA